jgi:hypothetical protein
MRVELDAEAQQIAQLLVARGVCASIDEAVNALVRTVPKFRKHSPLTPGGSNAGGTVEWFKEVEAFIRELDNGPLDPNVSQDTAADVSDVGQRQFEAHLLLMEKVVKLTDPKIEDGLSNRDHDSILYR